MSLVDRLVASSIHISTSFESLCIALQTRSRPQSKNSLTIDRGFPMRTVSIDSNPRDSRHIKSSLYNFHTTSNLSQYETARDVISSPTNLLKPTNHPHPSSSDPTANSALPSHAQSVHVASASTISHHCCQRALIPGIVYG